MEVGRGTGTGREGERERADHRRVLGVFRFRSQMMEEYQRLLRKTHSLDFDDLLSECVTLFEAHPYLVSGIRHTFVDEFQVRSEISFSVRERVGWN